MSHATEIVVTKNLPFLKFKLKNHLICILLICIYAAHFCIFCFKTEGYDH